MRVYNYYTSFLFGAVALIAQRTPYRSLQLLYQSLYGLSILNHAKYYEDFPGKMLIKNTDKLTAHTIAAVSIFIALTHPRPQPLLMFTFWCCLAWIGMVYYVLQKSDLPGYEWEPWHASVHVAGAVGQVALLMHDIRG